MIHGLSGSLVPASRYLRLRLAMSAHSTPMPKTVLTASVCICISLFYLQGFGCIPFRVVSAIQKSAGGPVSRILSRTAIPLDAALLPSFISDLPGGFRYGDLRHRRAHVGAPGRHATAGNWASLRSPSLFGLAPCGVYPASALYSRSGALLPHLFTLTLALARGGGIFSVALAVPAP